MLTAALILLLVKQYFEGGEDGVRKWMEDRTPGQLLDAGVTLRRIARIVDPRGGE